MKSTRLLFPLLLVMLGCSDMGERAGEETTGAERDGPATEYIRELVFVPEDGGTDAPSAMIMHFAATSRGSGVGRAARAWSESGQGWRSLYDMRWRDPPVRQAWRLVPQGPVRLIAGMDDEIEAVVVERADTGTIRFEPGGFVTEWSPDPGAQILLREGWLAADGDTAVGWVVDARFGLVSNGASADKDTGAAAAANGQNPDDPAAGTDAAAAEQNAPGGQTGAGDTLAAGDTATGTPDYPAIARRRSSVRRLSAVLDGGDDTVLLLGAGDGGNTLFVWRDGLTESYPVELRTDSATEGERTLRIGTPGTLPAPGEPDPPGGAVSGRLALPAGDTPAAAADTEGTGDARATADDARGAATASDAPVPVAGQLIVAGRPYDVTGVLLGPTE